MRSVRPRMLLLGAPVVVAALLAGCSSDPKVGPLGAGSDRGQLCMPGRVGQKLAVGLYDLHNYSKSPVKITGMTLPHPHGLKMTGGWLTPILKDPSDGDWEDIGVGYPFPPTFSTLARVEWRRRVPLIGAVIKPHQDPNLVFALTRIIARYGISPGPSITYTSAGHTWTLNEPFSLAIAANCNKVPG